MNTKVNRMKSFSLFSRTLHWLMAAMIIAMLFIGVGMVASLTDYHWLLSIHRPLGIAILIVAVIRLVNRLINKPPPLPDAMPCWQKAAAKISHIALYVLMISMPLIGWGMLSAGNYPVVLYGALHLPPLLPAQPELYSFLRCAHTVFAFAFFAMILLHLSAALMHALIFKDGVFKSMTSGK